MSNQKNIRNNLRSWNDDIFWSSSITSLRGVCAQKIPH